MNENKSTVGMMVVKSNSFVCFLEETSAWKNHFEFVWPLEYFWIDEISPTALTAQMDQNCKSVLWLWQLNYLCKYLSRLGPFLEVHFAQDFAEAKKK